MHVDPSQTATREFSFADKIQDFLMFSKLYLW